MASCTLPLPLPLSGGVIAIHGTPLDAVHEHSGAVVTPTFWDPPTAGSAIVSGATDTLQPLSCITVNVWPAAVIVPVRAVDDFGAAAN
jgi:hypothetical protein